MTPRLTPKRRVSSPCGKTIYVPIIKTSIYATRAKPEEKFYFNWLDEVKKCVNNKGNNEEEQGYVYNSITGNVQYCQLDLDETFLRYLKQDMNLDKKKKARWQFNENVKFMRTDPPFSTIKNRSEKCKEKYKICVDVFNTTLSDSLFCEKGCDMNYNYSWMETYKGNKVQSPHVDFSEDETSHGNFLNVIIPLTDTGCYIYVWPAFAHMNQSQIAGKLVFIQYGKGFVIPSNIVHAGGISVEGKHPRVGTM